jgi:hypothetical protein
MIRRIGVRRLKIAVNQSWSKTTYVEAAIQERLKKDGL